MITFKKGKISVSSKLHFSYLLFILIVFSLLAFAEATAQNRKIAIFGSSVAYGSGDTTGAGGYAGLIKCKLEKKGWEVANISKGGDNTSKILPRFTTQLLPQKPKFVIIGLSLGNEGIASPDLLARNRCFEKFRSGMLHLVKLCRDSGMFPVVVNCYTRNDFQPEQYAAIKKMNLIINTWDVPSINVLGTIDNGKGNWLDGYFHDKSHPDFKGHREMSFAFVPSLFNAIEAGKGIPYKIRSSDCLAIIQPTSDKPLSFRPDDTIHSFSVSFLVKTKGNGTLAIVKGTDFSSMEILNGKITYRSAGNQLLSSDTTGENKGWQYIVLTYQYATGQTSFFVNGRLIGNLTERIDFKEFILGGTGGTHALPAPDEANYKDLLIYRSKLNIDEVEALYFDQLLQSSLEIYSPLNDKEYKPGNEAANYAQSLSKLMIDGNSLKSTKQ